MYYLIGRLALLEYLRHLLLLPGGLGLGLAVVAAVSLLVLLLLLLLALWLRLFVPESATPVSALLLLGRRCLVGPGQSRAGVVPHGGRGQVHVLLAGKSLLLCSKNKAKN